MTRRLLSLELCLVAALGVTAGAGFHRVFSGRGFLVPLALAAIGAPAVSALCRWRRTTWSGSIFLSFSAYLLMTMYTVLSDTTPNILPTVATFKGLAGGLVNGWADLLTATLPARADASLMVAAIAMIWVTTMVSAEFVLRTRHVLAPVLPPIAAFIGTLALAAAQPRSPLALPLVFGGLTLLLLLVHVNRWATLEPGGLRLRRDDPTSPEAFTERSSGRSIATGIPVLLGGVVIAGLVGSVLPNEVLRKPFAVRDARAERVVVEAAPSPLTSLKDQLKLEPKVPLFSIAFEEPDGGSKGRDALGSRLRLMTLDAYDGANWSSTANYRKVGAVLPEVDLADAARATLVQTVLIDELKGPWLPAADRPLRIEQPENSVVDVEFDLTGGTLLSLTEDRSGLTYQVVSSVLDSGLLDSKALVPPSGKGFAVGRFLPAQVPPELGELARRMVGDANEPLAQLKALEQALSATYGYSERVSGGHSVGRIRTFLLEEDSGYAEQFASAYALMARLLGYPSRLVVGYLLEEQGNGQALGNEPVLVTSRSMHVWPEVYLAGAGWIGFDPTPARTALPPTEDEIDAAEASAIKFREIQNSFDEPFVDGLPQQEPTGGLSTGWSIVLGLFLALLTGLFCLPLAKVLRSRIRRRRARTPADRVLGSWAEVTDKLLEVGVRLQRSMTTAEVVEASSIQLGSEAAQQLGEIAPAVREALFSPDQPADSVADQVAEQAVAFGRLVRLGQPWQRRVLAWFNPRPLLS